MLGYSLFMTIQWTDELEMEICTAISSAQIGIRKLCALEKHKHWPNPDTIMLHVIESPRFSERYARAKLVQMQILAEDTIDISDDSSNDTLMKEDRNGDTYEVCNNEWVNRSRLRVDTRKWLTAKLCPRIFGEGFLRKIPYRLDLSKPLDFLGQEILDKAAQGLISQDEALYNFEILKKHAELTKIPEIERSLKDMIAKMEGEQNLPPQGVINANQESQTKLDKGRDKTSGSAKKNSRRKKGKTNTRKKVKKSSSFEKPDDSEKGKTGDDAEET